MVGINVVAWILIWWFLNFISFRNDFWFAWIRDGAHLFGSVCSKIQFKTKNKCVIFYSHFDLTAPFNVCKISQKRRALFSQYFHVRVVFPFWGKFRQCFPVKYISSKFRPLCGCHLDAFAPLHRKHLHSSPVLIIASKVFCRSSIRSVMSSEMQLHSCWPFSLVVPSCIWSVHFVLIKGHLVHKNA